MGIQSRSCHNKINLLPEHLFDGHPSCRSLLGALVTLFHPGSTVVIGCVVGTKSSL